MDLSLLVKHLDAFGNLDTAKIWDNVGLLVEPSEPLEVKRLLVTNDLTEPVLAEALEKNVQLIVAYHPAIFKPLKRLTMAEWKQRSIVKCIENRIAVYSPHTTWDAINVGINDWILQAFDVDKVENVVDIKTTRSPCGFDKSLKLIIPLGDPKKIVFARNVVSLKDEVKFMAEKTLQYCSKEDALDELEFVCTARGAATLIEYATELFEPSVLETVRITDLDKPLMKNEGHGRLGYLKEPITISKVVELMKSHLKMKTFRLALGNGKTMDSTVQVLAIGAGTCSGLLNQTKADFIITGEFTHHEILAEVHRGVSMIVTDHTNTERGFIAIFKQKFLELTENRVEVLISEKDRDPLEYI